MCFGSLANETNALGAILREECEGTATDYDRRVLVRHRPDHHAREFPQLHLPVHIAVSLSRSLSHTALQLLREGSCTKKRYNNIQSPAIKRTAAPSPARAPTGRDDRSTSSSAHPLHTRYDWRRWSGVRLHPPILRCRTNLLLFARNVCTSKPTSRGKHVLPFACTRDNTQSSSSIDKRLPQPLS